jgi:hypothetical protein
MNRSIFTLLIFALVLSACQTSPQPESGVEVVAESMPVADVTTPQSSPVPTSTPVLSPDSATLFDAYLADLQVPARTSAEDWQEWPIIPEMTRRAYEIYYQGLLQGNNPRAFSKVGDCQNIKDAFLGKYDNLERYPLEDDQSHLLDTIENFSGYFDTDGQAVRGGFSAATVLSALRADQNVCLPGENPLDCELRLTRPSIVFISFEVWWEGRTVETYEKYMRQVIETVIEHGAVPILATKADNIEGDHSINLATARLAQEYDLPLWNFWASVQPLPNQGMDMERNDGFHIAPAAWSMRSITALESLDHVWQSLNDIQTYIDDANATEAPIASATEALVPPQAFTWDYPNNILFELFCYEAVADCTDGIYRLDMDTLNPTLLLEGAYHLEALSPAANKLLLSVNTVLYLVDRYTGEIQTITSDLHVSNASVGWLSDSLIVYLTETDTGQEISFYSLNGDVPNPPSNVESDMLAALYVDTKSGILYWDETACSQGGECALAKTQGNVLGLNQALGLVRSENAPILFGSDYLAYPRVIAQNESVLVFADLNGVPVREYPLPMGEVGDFAWSADGKRVALTLYEQSSYSGRILDVRNLSIDTASWGQRMYVETVGFAPQILWSPDGSSLVWLGTQNIDEVFQVVVSCLEGCTDPLVSLDLLSSTPVTVQQAFWLP